MQIGTLLLWFPIEGCLSGSCVWRCLRMDDSGKWRSPVKAISRDTGVILAETAPLSNDGGVNCVDPQELELLIGNRWQRWLIQGYLTGGLLWCSAAQVRNDPVLVELVTRATQFSAVSRIATARQDIFIEPFLFSGSGAGTGSVSQPVLQFFRYSMRIFEISVSQTVIPDVLLLFRFERMCIIRYVLNFPLIDWSENV